MARNAISIATCIRGASLSLDFETTDENIAWASHRAQCAFNVGFGSSSEVFGRVHAAVEREDFLEVVLLAGLLDRNLIGDGARRPKAGERQASRPPVVRSE